MFEREIELTRELFRLTIRPHKPAPVVTRYPFIDKYVGGLKGFEIGPSADNDFGLDVVKVSLPEWEDFFTHAKWQFQWCGTFVVPDVWADSVRLPFKNSQFGFGFSSHVLEHEPNLIKTLREAHRVIKKGGYLICILPLRNALWQDAERDITPFEHFLEDFENDVNEITHKRDSKYVGHRGHYHIFTPDSFAQVATCCNLFDVVEIESPDSRIGNGFTVILKVK